MYYVVLLLLCIYMYKTSFRRQTVSYTHVKYKQADDIEVTSIHSSKVYVICIIISVEQLTPVKEG